MARTKVAHYSPEDVDFIVAGMFPATGMVDGSFITIEKEENPYTSIKTADGKVARMSNSDQTYKVTLTLSAMSDFNSTLTNLWLADELTGQGKYPLMIKDNLGNSLFFSGTAWISELPITEYSLDMGVKEWVFTATQCSQYFGGNYSQAGLVQSLISGLAGAIPEIQNAFR